MPSAPQEEELLWQLCGPATLEDANFHGSILSKACMPSLRDQCCAYAHQFFPSAVWDDQGRATGEGNSVFSVTFLCRRGLSQWPLKQLPLLLSFWCRSVPGSFRNSEHDPLHILSPVFGRSRVGDVGNWAPVLLLHTVLTHRKHLQRVTSRKQAILPYTPVNAPEYRESLIPYCCQGAWVQLNKTPEQYMLEGIV